VRSCLCAAPPNLRENFRGSASCRPSRASAALICFPALRAGLCLCRPWRDSVGAGAHRRSNFAALVWDEPLSSKVVRRARGNGMRAASLRPKRYINCRVGEARNSVKDRGVEGSAAGGKNKSRYVCTGSVGANELLGGRDLSARDLGFSEPKRSRPARLRLWGLADFPGVAGAQELG